MKTQVQNNHISIQSSAFPFGYDKNGAANRNTKRFAIGFNAWAMEIREANMPEESIMNARLKEAKKLINQAA